MNIKTLKKGGLVIVSLSITASCKFSGNNNSVKGEIDFPNIIYILADDLGYGNLSCYGQKFRLAHCLNRHK